MRPRPTKAARIGRSYGTKDMWLSFSGGTYLAGGARVCHRQARRPSGLGHVERPITLDDGASPRGRDGRDRLFQVLESRDPLVYPPWTAQHLARVDVVLR